MHMLLTPVPIFVSFPFVSRKQDPARLPKKGRASTHSQIPLAADRSKARLMEWPVCPFRLNSGKHLKLPSPKIMKLADDMKESGTFCRCS